MNRAIKQFETNIENARQLGLIFLAFNDKVTEVICLDELLRAEIVMAVSAFDCYIHDIVRIEMTHVFNSSSAKSEGYLNFGVSLALMENILRSTDNADRITLFDQEIRRLHGYKTFQTSQNISQALSFIGVKAVWDKVSAKLGQSPADVKTKLDIIIDRRNRIAHESDIDPTGGIGTRYPIDFITVKEAVSFIDTIAHCIQQIVIEQAETLEITNLNKGGTMKNLMIGLLVIVTSFFVVSGCQTPLSSSKGSIINRTNHNFLSEAGVDEKTNPHKEEKCQVCHTAPNELLAKDNALENELIQRKQMRTDLIDLCVQCHRAAEKDEHTVGVGTKLNKENLPLDHEGKITCATSCHDVHTKAPAFMKSLIRRPVNTLCLSCHDV